MAQNVAVFNKEPIRSEYKTNFSQIQIKKKRCQTANTSRSKASTSQSTKVEVWTRDSIVNVNKMRQPESFKELIAGEYQNQHIESQKEKDRIEHLNQRFTKGNPRIFRNFIDTNSNLLRKQIQSRKMERMKMAEETEKEIQDSVKSGSGQFRNYNPGALKLLRPTLTINKLLSETNKNFKKSAFDQSRRGLPIGLSSLEKANFIKQRLNNDYE